MSNPVVTKVTKLIAQGPPSAQAATTKVTKFIIVDTTVSDTSTSARPIRQQTHIRYGDNS